MFELSLTSYIGTNFIWKENSPQDVYFHDVFVCTALFLKMVQRRLWSKNLKSRID